MLRVPKLSPQNLIIVANLGSRRQHADHSEGRRRYLDLCPGGGKHDHGRRWLTFLRGRTKTKRTATFVGRAIKYK